MRLRVQIALMMIGVLLGTTAIILGLSYIQVRENLESISRSNISLSGALVRRYVQSEIDSVEHAAQLLSSRLQRLRNEPTTEDFEELLKDLIKSNTQLTFASVSLSKNGDYTHVERRGQDLYYQICKQNGNGTATRRTYKSNILVLAEASADYDPRKRPFFRAASVAKKPVWTQTYTFRSIEGPGELGVTHAIPVYSSAGALRAVVTADVSLEDLRSFISTVKLGDNGQILILERRENEAMRVIARGSDAFNFATKTISSDDVTSEAVDSVAKTGDTAGTLNLEVSSGRILGGFVPVNQQFNPNWIIVSLMPEDDLLRGINQTLITLLIVAGIALALSFLSSTWLASKMARPLSQLTSEAERLTRLDVSDDPLPKSRIVEVEALVTSVSKLRKAMASFSRLVPSAYVKVLVQEDREAVLGGDRKRVTTLFGDLQGFSSYAESHSTDETFATLGQYLDRLTKAIQANQGTVDKYMGDGIMAFWGAPENLATPETEACKAALECVEAVRLLRIEGYPFQLRIGIASGECLVGNVGSQDRLNYTLIGDSVNLAARLEQLNKERGTAILVDDATKTACGAQFTFRDIGMLQVKGRERLEQVWELVNSGTHG